MKWVKASERFPIDGNPNSLYDVVVRRIGDDKANVISNNMVWRYHENEIELVNEVGGDFFKYSEVEWLDEAE